MNSKLKEKKELLDLATDFSGFVKKNGWVTRYDTESDAFSVTAPKLSPDARIRYFDGDEIAFYITNNKKVEGIFVEYFKSNFVEHHKDLKGVMKGVASRKDEGLVELSQKKINQIAPDIEEAIKLSLAERMDINLGV